MLIPEGYYTYKKGLPFYFYENDTLRRETSVGSTLFLYQEYDTIFATNPDKFDTLGRFDETKVFLFPDPIMEENISWNLKNKGVDFDIFTTPFKFRLPTSNHNMEVHTSFNGSFYFGYRFDNFNLKKERVNSNIALYKYNNWGAGLGGFIGFGSANINTNNTLKPNVFDYDAPLINYGLALLLANKNLSSGIAFGFDQLIDGNQHLWIYNQKPWFGIFIGLNLN
jgi:hypothetical protein